MTLDDYFSEPDALSVHELRQRIRVKSDIQIRQWRHGYNGRRPSPAFAMAIETATDGRVMRWDLRPDDWRDIWPDLADDPRAPNAAVDAEQGEQPAEVRDAA